MSDDIQNIAVAVVLCGNRVLVGRREAGSHLAGMLEFPGGKVRAGERPEAAALRELREETGLDAVLESCLLVQEYAYGERRLRLHFFLCRREEYPPPPARPPFRWEETAGLAADRFPAANAAILARLCEGGLLAPGAESSPERS